LFSYPYFRLSNYERYPRGTDPILPAVLEFREETEEAFLHAVVTDLDPAAPHFKLAPTYTLYLVARYRASTHYRPELTPTERAHRLTVLLARVAAIIHNVIQVLASLHENCVCNSSCLCQHIWYCVFPIQDDISTYLTSSMFYP